MRVRLLAVLLCCTATPLFAQARVEVSGTIVGIEGNRIGIRDDNGNIYQAEVTKSWRGADGVTYIAPNAPTIMVTGTEDPKNLRPGQAIQFTATLAGRRTVVGEVKNATLVTLTPDSRAGILNADPVEAPATDDEDKSKKKPENLEECLILGAITKSKAGTITVTAPGLKSLTFRFADDATITVSGSDLSLVRIGDKITAAGTAIQPAHFATQDVKIEHSPAVEARPARRIKPGDVAKEGGKPAEGENPFALGEAKPVMPAKPKVKLELIKTN